ncbi:MAG: hypothetical protein MUC86_05220 [Burkholderiaceae bacterium]|jgi:hypothetical protein|nr:hypothetical protein [Burkholderiaceae bacterium]
MSEWLSPRRRGPRVWAAAALLLAGAAHAALILPGTPTTGVPTGAHDPLATLTDPLPAGQFLLPIEVSGASGLKDWVFDLGFDDAVVAPLDVGGLYQHVYQAEFSVADPTLSDITSSGLVLPGALLGVAGLSWGLDGDGTLAYLLFEFRAGREGQNPGFFIDPPDPPDPQPVPEPPLPWLLGSALLALAVMRRGGRGARQEPTTPVTTLPRRSR